MYKILPPPLWEGEKKSKTQEEGKGRITTEEMDGWERIGEGGKVELQSKHLAIKIIGNDF